MENREFNLEKSEITFKIDKSEIEGIKDLDIFPSHFLGVICGCPGSGKTTLLKFMMTHEKLLFKKFDEVLILSPSVKEFDLFLLPKNNMVDKLDWEFINDKIKLFNGYTKKFNIGYTNVLIIIDDFITELNNDKFNTSLKKLVFNR